MSTLIRQEKLLTEKAENAVLSLIDSLCTQDVFDSQEGTMSPYLIAVDFCHCIFLSMFTANRANAVRRW